MGKLGRINLSEFQIVRTIGVGSFSHVDLCFNQTTGQYCVLKVMSKQQLYEQNQLEHVQSERDILEKLDHPNIVRTLGTYQDETSLYIAMEYIPGGEVFSHLRTMGRFEIDVARFYAAELVLVFQYIHSIGIIYRDLKPENLLFNAEGHIKIVDFGFAKQIVDRTYTLCGTPEYLAPEVIRGEGAGFASDWWAVGILIYEMLVGQTPFFDENENAMYQQICRGDFFYPEDIDENTQNLINGLLQVDTSQRLGCTASGAEEIKQHPWFEGVEWDKVYSHMYQPPLVPYVESEDDSNNYPDYTGQLTPDEPLSAEAAQLEFTGF